jgi:beta-N-acetylglucosaminidase
MIKMGMEYKGLDANTELSLLVVTPKGKDTIYTFTVQDEFVDMSSAEVTRLRDELSFLLEHERQHAEAAQARHFNEVCEQSDMDQLNGPLG